MVAVKEFKNIAAGTAPALTDTAIGVQSGTTDVQYTFAQIQSSIVPPIRTTLTGNLSLYVNASTGSDSYNGLSATYTGGVNGPWATTQHAADVASQAYDWAGYDGFVNLAAGAYDGFTMNSPYSSHFHRGSLTGGFWTSVIVFTGDAADPIAVSIGQSSDFGTMFQGNNLSSANVAFSNLTLDGTLNTTDSAFLQNYGTGVIWIGDGTGGTVRFIGGASGTAGDAIVPVGNGAAIYVSDNVDVVGGQFDYLYFCLGGYLGIGFEITGATVTFSGNPSFGGCIASASGGSVIPSLGTIDDFATYVGTATGTNFLAGNNGTINVAGAGGGLDFYPGSSPGGVSNGGKYIYADNDTGSIVFDDGSALLNNTSPGFATSALPNPHTFGLPFGARTFVNDALNPLFGSPVAGGGAVTVPVFWSAIAGSWIVG
jgi:hypothetical protein